MEINNNKNTFSIEQLTNMVKRKDATYAFHVFIPSLQKDVRFSEINTAQQIRLTKAIIDSPIYKTEFICTFRDIIKENCLDDIDINNLTIIDKLIIALILRINSVGKIIKLEIETENKDANGKNIKTTVNVDLSDIFEKVKTELIKIEPIEIKDDYFKIVCAVPTIKTEYDLEKEIRSNVSDIEIKNVQELRETIADQLKSEIVKYIQYIESKNENDDGYTNINWDKFNFKDRIKIAGLFKTKMLKDIIVYINDVKKEVNKIEIINVDINGKNYKQNLEINSSFFSIS